MTLKIAKISKEFFEVKNLLQEKLKLTNEKNSSQDQLYIEINNISLKLQQIIENSDSLYFKIKIKNLKHKLESLIEKRVQIEKDFEQIFIQLNKINETDSVEFLNQSLKSRLDKILFDFISDEKYLKDKKLNLQSKKNLTFFTFSYQMVHFFCLDSIKREIKKNVEIFENCIEYNDKAYSIFPDDKFGLKKDSIIHSKKNDILMLHFKKKPIFLRFDELGEIFTLSEEQFQKMIKKMSFPLNTIKHYIQRKRLKYYFIDDSFTS